MVDNAGLAFTTAYRYERIVAKGNKTFSISSFGTVTIPHGLTYKPYFKLFYKYGNGNIYAMFAGTSSFGIDGTNQMSVTDIWVDNTNIYVSLLNNLETTVTGTIYYRVYAEPTV